MKRRYADQDGYRRGWSSVPLLCLAVVAAGCGEELGCESIGAPAFPMFQVTVVDSATGAPAWWGAHGVITDGTFREDLIVLSDTPADSSQSLPLLSTGHRVGTYTVTVERAGYATWSIAGQEIRRSGCFLTSISLTARLQRSP